jgi:structural maintenance of chromosome 1
MTPQVIDFGPSYFTCIIGPNGSGKSNLMDAISFVLGVKSSQLRSNILKDLIYRGRDAAQGQEGNFGAGGDGDNDAGGTTAKILKKTKEKKDTKQTKSRKRKQREDDSDASDEDEEVEDDDEDEGEEDEEEDDESEEEEGQAGATRTGENDAKTAWVMAVYEDADAKEFKYKRSINSKGSSTYSLNGRAVTHTTYNQSLEKHNILVKAKNFLVFQGDVEAVAQQNPKELSKLIDQISGSLDYAEEYNTAKATQERITETATLNYSKKRGITSEARHYREQKEEVTRWETLKEEREELIVQHTLWRLFHIKGEIDVCQAKIDEAEDRMKGLKRDQVS